eukprot:TRINITY_DN1564_c0_g1_i2.p1 TRINITY_DN1564_c0_g1~~TRINITY_DN1564_c0_g1_i2.p1  ORF type:complete len:150 (+),score=10.76 TRINITY_DN1564_c0_g1_i2:69-452(+)
MCAWQPYVDNNLVGTGHVTKAAILGHDGSAWATTAGFAVAPAEASALIKGFGDAGPLRASGLFVQGEKYLVLKADERSIYGKKGTSGVVCVKTGQSVLVGIYNDKIQPGQASSCVEKLADYLIDQGY